MRIGSRKPRAVPTPRGCRPERVAPFLEVVYDLDRDDQTWLAQITDRGREIWGRDGAVHSALYDASDPANFRPKMMQVRDFSDEAVDALRRAIDDFTPELVARTFRALSAGLARLENLRTMQRFHNEMETLGHHDCLAINGVEPTGHGVFLGYWTPTPVSIRAPELALYRRLGHHLATAYRFRRRLRGEVDAPSSIDVTDGAEAILDARSRVVHATGPAKSKAAQAELIASAKARDGVRVGRTAGDDGLRAWPPLTSARWTLVDRFERGGARYVVARENQVRVRGLGALARRETHHSLYCAVDGTDRLLYFQDGDGRVIWRDRLSPDHLESWIAALEATG